MKNFIWTLLLFFVFVGNLFSQNTEGQIVVSNETATKGKLENALLWEINKEGLPKPSYLYGTIHIIDAENFFLPEGTEESFDKTEQVTFEIDMDEMNDMTAIFSMMFKIMMPEGKTLASLLSQEDYNFVKSEFDKMGMGGFYFSMFEKMKPLFLSVFASTDVQPGSFDMGSMKSYEIEFAKMAEAKNKETFGLETIDFQISIFDSIPYKAQAQMLVQTLKSSDEGEDELGKMIELYKSQNIDAMQSSIDEDASGLGKYEEILLNKRNSNWIPIMEKMMMKKPTFFAVGAGHLGGPNGVIPLLRKQGYSVTPVKK